MNNSAKVHDISNLSLIEFISIGQLFQDSGLSQWGVKAFQDIHNHPEKWFGIKGFVIKKESNIISAIIARESFDFTEIIAIATNQQYLRQEYASQLLKHLITLHKYPYLLEVSIQNHSAINLYQKHGFKKISTRKNYYTLPDKSQYDALILQLDT